VWRPLLDFSRPNLPDQTLQREKNQFIQILNALKLEQELVEHGHRDLWFFHD
jgi:hypothetical protein